VSDLLHAHDSFMHHQTGHSCYALYCHATLLYLRI